MYYWLFKTLIFVPWTRLVVRPKLVGRSNVPATGGVILAANHSSAIETLLLPASVKRKVIFPAKASLFRKRKGDWKHNLVAWFLTAIGQVPLDRTGGRASVDAMGPVAERLAAGHVVGIFPEGTRTPDGRLYRGKTGVARLALVSGSPVVPVGMINTAPKNLWDLLRHRPQIIFGEPVAYTGYVGRENDHEVLRWVTDDVIGRIQQCTGQTYVDAYSSSVKKGDVVVDESKLLANPHEGKPTPEPNQAPAAPAVPAAPADDAIPVADPTADTEPA